MKKKLKKAAALLLACLVCIMFVGCGRRTNISLYVSISRWAIGSNERIDCGEYVLKNERPGDAYLLEITMERSENIVILATARYDDTNEIVPNKYMTESFSGYESDEPGLYILTQEYKGYLGDEANGGYALFSIHLEILENRSLPEMEFDGGEECIRVEGEDVREGLKFVYKYDGESHFPSVRLMHEGKEVVKYTDSGLDHINYNLYNPRIYDGEKFVKLEYVGEWTTEVGLYLFDFIVSRSDLPDEYEDTFCDINIPLYIEIVA